MNKKILLIGVLLIVIVIIIGLFAPSSVSSPFQVKNITVAHNSYSSMAFNITSNRTIFVILGSSSIPIDIYIFNNTGFNIWKSKVASNPSNGYFIANALMDNGVIELFHNTTAVLYQNGASSQNVSATSNGVLFYNKTLDRYGNTIFVFDNDLGNNTNASISLNYISPTPVNAIADNSKLSGFGTAILEIYSVLFVVGIIGIALVVYGIIKKDNKSVIGTDGTNPIDIEERNKLYSKINKSKRVSGKKSTNKSGKKN